jgi:hypothetical protein
LRERSDGIYDSSDFRSWQSDRVSADAGKQVYLAERSATIGGPVGMFDETLPTLDYAAGEVMCHLNNGWHEEASSKKAPGWLAQS